MMLGAIVLLTVQQPIIVSHMLTPSDTAVITMTKIQISTVSARDIIHPNGEDLSLLMIQHTLTPNP